ncbi:MAG: hypothetical protein ACREIU_09460, partial [Planctomycetota bacterium]
MALLVGLLGAVLLLAGDRPPATGRPPEPVEIATGPSPVEANPPGGTAAARSLTDVSAPPGIVVRGRSAQGVRPLGGALVQLIPREPRLHGFERPAPVATGPDGLAPAGMLPPGRWRASVFADGFLGAEKDFDAPVENAAAPPVEMVLDALASIHGTVRTKEGSPVPDAMVEVLFPSESKAWTRFLGPGDRLAWAAERRGSGDGGSFERSFLPPGLPLQINVGRPGTGRVLLPLDPLDPGEARGLSVVLNRPTGLVGRVASDGSIRDREAVVLSRVVDGGRGLIEEDRTSPSQDGAFRFDDISPGPKLLQYTREAASSFGVGCLGATAVEAEIVDVGTIVVRPSALILLAGIPDEPHARRPVRIRGTVVQEGPDPSPFPLDLQIETGVQAVVAGLPAGLLGIVAYVQRKDEG